MIPLLSENSLLAAIRDSGCQMNTIYPNVSQCYHERTIQSFLIEQRFISLALSIIFLLLGPIRIFFLRRRTKRVNGKILLHLKIGSTLLYAIVQALLLVSQITRTNPPTSVKITAVLSLVNASILCLLSYLEHERSLKPSALSSLYLSCILLLGISEVRTLALERQDAWYFRLFVLSLCFKLAILVLETKEKYEYFINLEDKLRGPEEYSGIINKSLFFWLNHFVITGGKKLLVPEDLYPLDEQLSSSYLSPRFWSIWGNEKYVDSRYRILFAIFFSSKWTFFLAGVPRLIMIGFTICQPLLIRQLLDYLSQPNLDDSLGQRIIGGYAFVYFGLAISAGFYAHQNARWLTEIRGSLVPAIYRKTLASQLGSDNSVAVTLMSTDVERVLNGFNDLHSVWASALECIIATVLLWSELRFASVTPIAIAIASAIGSAYLTTKVQAHQKIWMEKLQLRVAVTTRMLSAMKGVKLSGLTRMLSNMVQQMRIDEIKSSTGFRRLMIYTSCTAFVPYLMSPAITFGVFIFAARKNSDVLDSSKIFTSLSLMTLLSQPLISLFQMLPSIASAIGCLRRIEEYLLQKPHIDTRLFNTPRFSGQESGNSKAAPSDMPTTFFPSEINAITVRGTFGWVQDMDILWDIDCAFRKSELTIIVGPIASGKSSVLKAVLGEISFAKGFVTLNGVPAEIGFCDQTSFLINTSLRKNILGFSNFDASWYSAVVDAVGLNHDLSTFPNGDQTIVGSGGITLSGGQRQRVAVARTVYARKQVSIFDDVLSGLDSATEQHVFDRVFGPQGLLRKTGSTVLLSTHTISHLPSADHIIALGKDGKIAEQGTFAELNSAEGYIQSFAVNETAKTEGTKEMVTQATEYSLVASRQTQVSDSTKDDRARQIGDFSIYGYYFGTVGTWNTVFFFIIAIFFACAFVLPILWLKSWSDAITGHHDFQQDLFYLEIYTIMQALGLVALYLDGSHVFIRMYVRAGASLHFTLLRSVMTAPMSFFSQTDSGITTNRFSQDMELIDGELPGALLNLASHVIMSFIQAILIATSSWYVALYYPFLLFIFYNIQRIYLATSRQLRFLDLEAKSPLYTHFLETISGLATIRAFGWSNLSRELNDDLLNSSQQPAYLLRMIQSWLALVLDLVTTFLALLVVTLAVVLRSNSGFTGVALVNIMSFSGFLRGIVQLWTQLETSIGSVSRVKGFSETTEKEDSPNENLIPPASWPHQGKIDIQNLSVSYDPTSDKLALQNISLSIKPGEKIGISGRSGSGKSSLILALFRMVEIQDGSITIDDIDISKVPRNHVRSRINAIPQDPYFLHGTFRLNIDPYESSLKSSIISTLKKVELWETIKAKGGLNAEMNIDMLSHGQRQLFCLARAMLRPGTIVVLDEATSSVDKKTDELMQRLIREEFSKHTIICVAHRLDNLLDFDRIVVMDEGRILKVDTPKVLSSTSTLFRSFYSSRGEVENEVASALVDLE